MKTCRFENCDKTSVARGLCTGHYSQFVRGQELRPLKPYRGKNKPPIITYDLVACPVIGLKGPCHIYRGGKDPGGYGRAGIKEKRFGVHRYVWIQKNGPIPEDLVIDHVCRNRACCNVDHLRLVTHRINMLENSTSASARNYQKTHCKRGHPFDESNTHINSRGHRNCRTCIKLQTKRRSRASL